MEHIDWQGVSLNIQNHLKRFAMTKSLEARGKRGETESHNKDQQIAPYGGFFNCQLVFHIAIDNV